MDLHEDGLQKLNRRGTLAFVKNVLISRMRNGGGSVDGESNSQASRFGRNLANLTSGHGLGVVDADLMGQGGGDLENGGRGGYLDSRGNKKKTGLERGRLDKTGGMIMIANE